MSSTTETPQFTFPIKRRSAYGPPAEYIAQQRTDPFAKVPVFADDAWMITRYPDAREMLESPDVSSNREDDRYPQLRNYRGFVGHPAEQAILLLDGEEHLKYRRMVSQEFSLKRVQAMRPAIQETANQVLDEMVEQGGPTNFVQSVSLTIASTVICKLLGVPVSDHQYFERLAALLLVRTQDPNDFKRNLGELVAYIDALVRDKVENPSEGDLISRLSSKVRSGELREGRLASFAMLLLLAGHETSANMISLGTLTFLRRPDLLQQVQERPELMPNAVSELLRYHSILDDITTRFALVDTVIAGRPIKAGEGLCASGLAVNFDPETFDNPYEIDFTRPNLESLAFGAGPHQCLGQNLARTELEIVYRTIFERIPTLRLAVPADEVVFKPESFTYGIADLPVEW